MSEINFNKLRQEKNTSISSQFADENSLIKSEENSLNSQEIVDFMKGRGHAIGTRKNYGGREYIKTADGWKYHGKGTGAKTKQHRSEAAAHIKTQRKNAQLSVEDKKKLAQVDYADRKEFNKFEQKLMDRGVPVESIREFYMKELDSHPNNPANKKKSTSAKFKVGTKVRIDQKGAKLISLSPFEGKELVVEKIVDTGLISEPQQIKVSDGKGSSIIVSKKDLKEVKVSESSKEHDHVISEGGKLTIDILDPDTEEKKFKEGDTISHGGKEYVVGKNLGDDIHALKEKSSEKSTPIGKSGAIRLGRQSGYSVGTNKQTGSVTFKDKKSGKKLFFIDPTTTTKQQLADKLKKHNTISKAFDVLGVDFDGI